MKPIFTAYRASNARLFFAIVVSVALMIADHRSQHLHTVRQALSVALSPIAYLVDMPARISRGFAEVTADRAALLEDNAHLREQHLLLRAKAQRLAAIEAENDRLRKLLGSSRQVAEEVQISSLISIDLDPFRHLIRIDKGYLDDVYPGQPLVDANGVVGQVKQVTPNGATVLLITDPQHAIPVEIERTGLRTVALGSGHPGLLKLPYLPNNADVVVGDQLLASGLGGRFPLGYPVASINSVQSRSGEPFAAVDAVPSALLERSREFLLVWPHGRAAPAEAPAP